VPNAPGAFGSGASDAQRALVVRIVEETLDVMAPMIERVIANSAISAEHALHVLVMDPTADAGVAFEDAILIERSYGDPALWKADYAWYAREKTRVSWRERRSLRTLLSRCPERLQEGDIRVEGAIRAGSWVIGVSGAQPWYDHAIASTAAHLLDAALAQASVAAASEGPQ
jgi:hypothetical protein